jgi:hypothetical protein
MDGTCVIYPNLFVSDDDWQLEHAEVYASNVSMKPGTASDRIKVYNVPSMNARTRNFTEQLDAIIAQYFIVELNRQMLTLCEFKLNEKGIILNLVVCVIM